MLAKRIKIQLLVFAVVSLIAGTIMFFNYMQVPTAFFGVDRYTVTVQLGLTGVLGLVQRRSVPGGK